jgi:adenosine deaminase CECR1
MSLLGWKVLCQWSIKHSCMNAAEKAAVTREWQIKWDLFCQWIVDNYNEAGVSRAKPISLPVRVGQN